jgi:L-glutamine:2-deoxy-scyllo-inosose/3-amino-2,3-dideoxy-scyllo-inosose aminotransferase
MATLTLEKLAIFGGAPLCEQALQAPPFPPVDEATARRLGEVYLSRKWSFGGEEETAFAAEFAAYHGAKHGVFMANGTVTLQCALGALGVGAGDEVIVPALTWPATAMAVLYVGATPVFVDVEPSTLCLDPAAFEVAITPATRAVIPVHLYGGTADLERILGIAHRREIFVVEDCAHGQGGKWNGRGLGSWGDVGSFSFQQSKTLAAGEGGICITNDNELAERLYRMKHIGYDLGTGQGKANSGPPPGLQCHNFRATEFQSLILRSQLEQLAARIATYNQSATFLEARLNALPGVRVQARGRLADPQSYYAFAVSFEGAAAQIPLSNILAALGAEGFSAGGTYGTVYNHVLWNAAPETYRIAGGSCRVAEELGTRHTLTFQHQWLESDEQTLESIAQIFEKVMAQADQLADWMPPVA